MLLKKLQFIHLGLNRRVTAAGLKHLVQLPLRDLSADLIDLDDNALAEIAKITTLERLTISGSGRVTDAGLRHLGTLQKLTSLDVNRTKATAKGVADLQTAIPKCKISAFQ